MQGRTISRTKSRSGSRAEYMTTRARGRTGFPRRLVVRLHGAELFVWSRLIHRCRCEAHEYLFLALVRAFLLILA